MANFSGSTEQVMRTCKSLGKDMAKIGGRLTGTTYVEERAGHPVEHFVHDITRESFARCPLTA